MFRIWWCRFWRPTRRKSWRISSFLTVTLRSCSARLRALSACAETTSPPMTSVAQTASDAPRVMSLVRSKPFRPPQLKLFQPSWNQPEYRQDEPDFLNGDVAFEGSDASRRRRWDGRRHRRPMLSYRGTWGEHVADRSTHSRPGPPLLLGGPYGRLPRRRAGRAAAADARVAAQGRRGAGTCGPIHAERARRSARRPARRPADRALRIRRAPGGAEARPLQRSASRPGSSVAGRRDARLHDRPPIRDRRHRSRPMRTSARRCVAISSAWW